VTKPRPKAIGYIRTSTVEQTSGYGLQVQESVIREYAKRGWSYSLADYRDRYAQQKTDKDLQAAHAAFPWIVTWDDHEVENNYAGGIDKEDPRNKAAIAERAAGYQAFYEHMPVRAPRPRGPDLKLYRSVSYGGLATFFVLDTRQYRDDQGCGAGYVDCPAAVDPARSITGAAQEAWLLNGFRTSRAPWDVIGQQVFFAQRDSDAGEPARRVALLRFAQHVAADRRRHRRESNEKDVR